VQAGHQDRATFLVDNVYQLEKEDILVENLCQEAI
jgi:hypothetical protein